MFAGIWCDLAQNPKIKLLDKKTLKRLRAALTDATAKFRSGGNRNKKRKPVTLVKT